MKRGGALWLSVVLSALMVGICCYSLYLAATVVRGDYSVDASDTTRCVVIDTVPYYEPMTIDSRILGMDRYVFPIIKYKEDTIPMRNIAENVAVNTMLIPDSVAIELPVLQRHYRDSVYEAWVSGPVDPRLDSVYVFPRREYVTIRSVSPQTKPKRWHVGISAGYAATRRGLDPYIGIGVTYSLWSF